MFENVDGRTDRRRTKDAGVTGILIAHLGAFGSGELIKLLKKNLYLSHPHNPIIVSASKVK